MKGVIDIESRPFSKTEYYAGIWAKDSEGLTGSDNYIFSVKVDEYEYVQKQYSVEWNDVPTEDTEVLEEIEQDILEQFKQQI